MLISIKVFLNNFSQRSINPVSTEKWNGLVFLKSFLFQLLFACILAKSTNSKILLISLLISLTIVSSSIILDFNRSKNNSKTLNQSFKIVDYSLQMFPKNWFYFMLPKYLFGLRNFDQNIKIIKPKKYEAPCLERSGVIFLDSKLRIISLNSTAMQIFKPNKILKIYPVSILNFLSRKLKKKIYESLEIVCLKKEPIAFWDEINSSIAFNLQKDGEFADLLFLILPKYNIFNERLENIVLIVKGISNRKKSTQTTNFFPKNLSHEFRIPIFGIKAFVETSQEYSKLLRTAKKKSFLETVKDESDYLTRLIEQLLILSRSNNIILNKTNFKFTLNHVLKRYHFFLEQKNLMVKSEVLTDNLLILGNRDSLFQIISNLINNSLKFTCQGGKIIIRIFNVEQDYPKRKLRVEILDTGIGMSGYDKELIFNPFFQVKVPTNIGQGTGFGLGLVKSLLIGHKANIRVSTKLNVGTLIWFDLISKKL